MRYQGNWTAEWGGGGEVREYIRMQRPMTMKHTVKFPGAHRGAKGTLPSALKGCPRLHHCHVLPSDTQLEHVVLGGD